MKPDIPTNERFTMSRRGFLISGTVLGTLSVGIFGGCAAVIPPAIERIEKSMDGPDDVEQTSPLVWFSLSPTDGITLYVPKGEMGQGVESMIAQLAAEELELPASMLKVQLANSTMAFGAAFSTFGSRAARSLYRPVRQAAAALRDIVLTEAARQMAVDRAQLVLQKDHVRLKTGSDKLTYAQLLEKKQGPWQVPKTPAALKPRSEFTQIGKPAHRVDAAAKVFGSATFGVHARQPGLLFGAVARPPRFGAKLKSVDANAAKQMAGVKAVVVKLDKNFVGVVADTRTRAHAAIAKLVLNYEGGSTMSQAEFDALLTATPGNGTAVRDRGDAPKALSEAAPQALGTVTIKADYRVAPAAHAHLEPLAATVHVKADSIEAWLPTQAVNLEARVLEGAFGKNRPIKVNATYMGGSFGRKGFQSAVLEAAWLSEGASAPVSIIWTREEEMRHSFYRQPAHTVMRGSVDGAGKIIAMEQTVAIGNTWTHPFGPGMGQKFLASAFDLDAGGFTGLFMPYGMANYKAFMRMVPLPLPTGIWRGVALLPNVFASESFVNELAESAKIDPLEFRINNLSSETAGERLRGALRLLKEKSDWSSPLPEGRGRGVACSVFSGSAVACAIEATPTVRDGRIVSVSIDRVTLAIDAGLVIDPRSAGLQARGSVIMGLSSALFEGIRIQNGQVVQRNFNDYPILRSNQAPKRMDVHFVDSPLDPQGMGEPVVGPIAPALAQAVFTATGQRLRSLPFFASNPS